MPRGWGVEAVAKDGCERGEERVADGLVVGGPYPVGDVPGAEGAGVGEKFVEARHDPHDFCEFPGELDFLLGHGCGEQRAQRRIAR